MGRRSASWNTATVFGAVVTAMVAALLVTAPPAHAGGSDAKDSTVDAFSGQFTTSVPIAAPPFRGLEPQVALVYGSLGGNGILGIGWGLAGGSTVERASPGRGAPRWDSADIYVLDGQVLVADTTLGGTHQTRVHSYKRIQRDAVNDRWYVWRKDGSKLTYAPTLAVTAQLPNGTTQTMVYRWAVTSLQDTKGNTVNYSYWCDGANDCYLSSITYNGNTVAFYLEGRPDPIDFATGGTTLGLTQYRIKTVDVLVGGSRARAYKLLYATTGATSRSRLTSVQQFGRDATLDGSGTVTGGTAVPAMTYGAAASYTPTMSVGSTWAGPWVALPVGNQCFTGDLNGDGKTDLWCYTGANGSWWVGLSTGSGWSGSYWAGAWVGLPVTNQCFTGDLNGDGKTDMWCYTGANGSWWVGLSTGSGWAGAYWTGPAPVIPVREHCLTGDLDGDGKTDMWCYTSEVGVAVVGISTGAGFTVASWRDWNYYSTSMIEKCFTGDLNGDGKVDMWCYTGASGLWQANFSTGTGWNNARWYGAWVGSPVSNQCLTGDLNGDGKTDMWCYAGSSGSWWIGLSTGHTGWVERWWSGADPGIPVSDKCLSGDLNGDGRADMWCKNPGGYWNVGLAATNGWVTYADTGPLASAPVSQACLTGDLDGDGKTDTTCYQGPGNGNWAVHKVLAPSDLMTTVGNGLGGTTTIAYVPSTAWSNTYVPVGTVLQTVSSVTISDGRGDAQATTYTYQGARWRNATSADPVSEFLGFRRATTTIGATGAYSETYYWQRAGTIAKPEVVYKRKADGTLLSYDVFRFTENAIPPYTSNVTEGWSYECNGTAVFDAYGNYVSGCRRILATYSWDIYANIIYEYQYGDYDVSGDERTAARSFSANTTAYIVGLPAYENMYAGIGTGGALLSRTTFTYDNGYFWGTPPTAGALTTKAQWNDQTGGYALHFFGYDSYGNETSMTNAVSLTATKAYDPVYHLYVTSTTDPKGFTATTAYDYVLGHPLTKWDINNNQTTYAYDALGRPTLVTGPDGSQTKYEYLSYGDPNNQRIRQSVLLPGTWSYEDNFFDGVGRAYKKTSQTGVTEETVYGPTGKVARKSLPYVAGETVRWIGYVYDEVGRENGITNPDGGIIMRAYANGMTLTADPLFRFHWAWVDGYQRVTHVRESIGGQLRDTYFYYDLLGRRTRSVDAAGNVTQVTFDSLGRVIQKSDPDQGLWTYQYNDLGQLVVETDALNQRTTLSYDTLGRVIKRLYADNTWDWFEFDSLGGGWSNGRLTASISGCSAANQGTCVVGANSVTTTAAYDQMGRRLSFGSRVGTGPSYTISHAYDIAGRLTSVTYPDGEVVAYGYGTALNTAFGKLVSVSGKVTNITYTARGQMATMTYANGVTTTLSYDAVSGEKPAQIQIGALAAINYGYDLAGKVTAMTSPQLARTNWSYGYDEVGRLTNATNTADGSWTQSFSYDAVGRMLNNSQRGAYTYGDAAHVHAVTAAGATTYAYDANGNLTAGAGRSIGYDQAHRPASITYGGTSTTFVYDALGQRVQKTANGAVTQYVGALYELRGGAVTKYYFAGGSRVAKSSGGTVTYFHADHLGSTRLMTNSAGAEVKRYEYAPYGKVINETGAAPDSHRFTGQEADDETGLMFYNARYYDPDLGRFIGPDAFVPDAADPQQLDLYAYANNSPINYVDPSGHLPVPAIVVAIFGAIGITSATVVATICNILIVLIGTALTFVDNPIIQTIGMIMAGAAGGALAGFTTSGIVASAVVAAAQSPISPLDPTVKKAIGWAYTAYCMVTNWYNLYSGATAENSWFGWTKAMNGSVAKSALGSGALLAAKEIFWQGVAMGVAYVVSRWGGKDLRFPFAFLSRAFVLGFSAGGSGPLAVIGSTYDLAYTLRYPDGRVIDLSGGTGGVAFEFYYHTGFESSMAFGRQHIRVKGPDGCYWEVGDAGTGNLGPGLDWGGWISTQKVTVIMSPGSAQKFIGAMTKAAQANGAYVGLWRDSNAYISASLQYATGKTAADLHINPGLIHFDGQ